MNETGFEYSPIIARKPLKWPGGARLAFMVHLAIEHFEFNMPIPGGLGPDAGKCPDVRNYSVRDYGNRVGVWRIIKLLDKYKVKVDALVNSAACDHYPMLIEEGKKRNWEFVGHGITNSRSLTNLPEDEERKGVKQAVERIAEAVGKRPVGWIGPNLSETFSTRDILLEEGMQYVMEWCNDDQPYLMRLKKGSLVSVPYSVDTNDLPAFNYAQLTPLGFYERVKEQFDVLYEEGATSGTVMGITLHPFVIGVPFRIKCLDKILQHITSQKNLWLATPSEIVDWCHNHYFAASKKRTRIGGARRER
jgi:allantoinase